MTPRTGQPSAEEAQRLADIHFVDRYDRAQLTALDHLDQLDRAATPLVVPDGINRVYRTEPTGRPTRLTVIGPEFRVTRDTVLTLLNLGLAHCDHLVLIDPDPSNRTGEQRTGYVLAPTRHGRDVLDVAHRIGRLPHSQHGQHGRQHGRKGTP
jgi:hypothetical protein